MKRMTTIAVLAGLTFAAGFVLAHDDAYLDTQKAPHGGQLRMAGPYHLELVLAKGASAARDNPVMVYVTDHEGKPVSTAGARGSATILSAKRKTVAELKPDGDNRLKGTAKYDPIPAVKVVVSVTLAGKPAEQARFTPLAAAQDAQTDHRH